MAFEAVKSDPLIDGLPLQKVNMSIGLSYQTRDFPWRTFVFVLTTTFNRTKVAVINHPWLGTATCVGNFVMGPPDGSGNLGMALSENSESINPSVNHSCLPS